MIEKPIVITNNPMAKDYFNNKFDVDFIEGSLMDVLVKVRDYIHKNHKLLTHPMMGSVKPNETPYKTVLISKGKLGETDIDSVSLIENSIATAEKFLKNKRKYVFTQKLHEDFMLIDLDLIKNIF